MTEAEVFVLSLKWRVGTPPRTVHAQLGNAPDEIDPLIGVMDTATFAHHIVKLHNDGLAGVREPLPIAGE